MKLKLLPPSNLSPIPKPLVTRQGARAGVRVPLQRKGTASVDADGVAEEGEVEVAAVENKLLRKRSLRRRSKELWLTFRVLRLD